MSVRVVTEDIGAEVDWAIHREEHVLVLHLCGEMDFLETELEGHGGSVGGALAGEVWTVPAGRRYAGFARGGVIRYAEIGLEAGGGMEMAGVAGKSDGGLFGRLASVVEAAADSGDVDVDLEEELRNYVREGYGLRERKAIRGAATLSRRRSRLLRGYIQAHLGEELRVDRLAEVAGMSVDLFVPVFRETFGMTPWQYVIQQRLREANRLLSSGCADISFVAMETGFSSHSHLTKMFRERYGMTPSVCRRSAGWL